MDTIEFNVKISVKDLNQALALIRQPLLTSEEEIKKYKDLTFDSSQIEESDVQMNIALTGLIIAAKAQKELETEGGGEC